MVCQEKASKIGSILCGTCVSTRQEEGREGFLYEESTQLLLGTIEIFSAPNFSYNAYSFLKFKRKTADVVSPSPPNCSPFQILLIPIPLPFVTFYDIQIEKWKLSNGNIQTHT
jgi:hypothetical protein